MDILSVVVRDLSHSLEPKALRQLESQWRGVFGGSREYVNKGCLGPAIPSHHAAILRAYAKGVTAIELGERFGLTRQAVHKIIQQYRQSNHKQSIQQDEPRQQALF